jgi:hypothetical protein
MYVCCSDLNTNALSGTIPSSIGQLTNLTQLYVCGALRGRGMASRVVCRSALYNNSLSGTIPFSIGNLTALTDLYVRGARCAVVRWRHMSCAAVCSITTRSRGPSPLALVNSPH